VKGVAALSVVGQLVKLGLAIFELERQSYQYGFDGHVLLFSRPTASTATVITSITSLSGLAMTLVV
jgi:hypothetical protein